MANYNYCDDKDAKCYADASYRAGSCAPADCCGEAESYSASASCGRSSRVEIDESILDVAGGRMTLAEAMGEAQVEKMNGGKGNFFVIWLKNLFKKDDTTLTNNSVQNITTSETDNYPNKNSVI